ncbi:hypothetical protein [uncultured Limosilactobacillus sp.]|uniref:hypothetical protein n=1 Tax=uncultured Limosilactobacillus sp. TaxID=2837629 RepID=UPI00258A4384|nr:hypothetical protein [uncultured Limosilactobacillus sp.]
MNERTFIDPEKFALSFAKSALIKNVSNEELTKNAKKFLLSYLTAYYLTIDFNSIERKNFNSKNTKQFEDMTFEELLNRVGKLNKY